MLESGDEEEVLTDKSFNGNKEAATKVLYRKKQPLRLLNNVNVTCVPSTDQKQLAVSGIIKYDEFSILSFEFLFC